MKKEKSPKKTVQKQAPQKLSLDNPAKRIKRNMAFVILLLSFIFYGNTLQNGYSMDDELVTLNHEQVSKGIKGIPEIFTSRYAVNAKQNYEYRPIVLVSFAIEAQLFGQKAGIGHFFNIVLYALTCFVLFLLLLRIFKNFHWILPVSATLLFLIHPIHTEVVASLKNRDEILSLLFALFSMGKALDFMEKGKARDLLFTILLMVVSLLSKKSSMTFIALIPFTLWFFSDKTKNKRVWLVFGTLVVSYILPGALMHLLVDNISVNRELMFFENPLNDKSQYGVADRIPMVFATIVYYLKLLVFPHPLRVFYGYDQVEVAGWNSPVTWLGMAIVSGTVFWCICKMKTFQPWIYGSLFFLTGISEFSNFVHPAPGIIAERFAFIPSVGFCILVAYGLLAAFKATEYAAGTSKFKFPASLGIIAVALFLACSVKVITRNKDWKSHLSIYQHDIVYTNQSAKLHSLMGTQYIDQLYKNSRDSRSLMGTQFIDQLNKNSRSPRLFTPAQVKTKTDSALYHFRTALEIYPDYVAVNNNLGTVYFNFVDDNDSAKKYFRRAVELDTDYVEALFNLASCYEKEIGKYDELKKYFTSRDTSEAQAGSGKPASAGVLKIMEPLSRFFNSYYQLKSRLMATCNTGVGVLMQNGDFSMANEEFRKSARYGLSGKLSEILSPQVMDSLCGAMVETTKEIYRSMSLTELNQKTNAAADKVLYPVIDSMVLSFYKELSFSSEEGKNMNKMLAQQSAESAGFTFNQTIACLNRSLEANPEYFMSYTKLIGIYRERNMGDSMIALASRLLSVEAYSKADLYTAIGNGYAMKNDDKNSVGWFDKVIEERERSLTRLMPVYSQLLSARFNEPARDVAKYITGFKRDIVNTCTYLAGKYSARGDEQSAQKYLLKAQAYK